MRHQIEEQSSMKLVEPVEAALFVHGARQPLIFLVHIHFPRSLLSQGALWRKHERKSARHKTISGLTVVVGCQNWVGKFFQWMSESQIVKLHQANCFVGTQTIHKSCPHKVNSNEDLLFVPPKIGNHDWYLRMKFLYEAERVWLRSFVCHICCLWKVLRVRGIWILEFSLSL